MIKRILVPMEPTPAGEGRVALAISLARRAQAALTLLQLVTSPYDFETNEEAIAAAEVEAQRLFDRMTREQVRAEWRVARSVADIGRIEAKLADLTIVGRRDGQVGIEIPPESVMLASGRPVLIMPGEGPFETLGNRVIVAWDGSREASRALRDALPLIERHALVRIVSVIDPGGGWTTPSVIPIDYLRDHGLHAEFEEIVDSEREIVTRLLARSAELDADLLVMGGYGHSRLGELVLGGTTRGMLQSATLPVLMSH